MPTNSRGASTPWKRSWYFYIAAQSLVGNDPDYAALQKASNFVRLA